MQQEIKYIGFYDAPKANFKRVSALAATNKMDYIAETINSAGYQVHFVSPSWFDDSSYNAKTQLKTTIQLGENKKLALAPSIGTSNKFTGYLKIVFSLFWLFWWLLIHVKKQEKIILYHSPWLVLPILWAKKIKGFQLILEVEEIYSDVSSLHSYFDKLEKKIFDKADYFLFSTELLAEKIKPKKGFIIVYGNYTVFENLASPPDDGKIHLVYAGIIDSDKAGAFNAIESALFLDENYVMHIIGFGEIERLQERINEINKTSKCKVSFDGTKSGIEYLKFCQTCHIGLSTQKMDGDYLDTSFPSKILSYLSLGLNVVSCDVKCVSLSKISHLVNFYNGYAEEIADAITKIDLKEAQYIKSEVKVLDCDFLSQIKLMLKI